jgi:dihydroorotate dehydrogenase
MRLRNVEFGHVFNASGARGFFGEGYAFHEPFKRLGLDYAGSTFVSKTTTLGPRVGNMPLDGDHQPRALVPDCIRVKPVAGVVLNAVGLSGPGVMALRTRWMNRGAYPTPFVISVMSVAPTVGSRRDEIRDLVGLLWPVFERAPLAGLQINLSCPNAGLDPQHLVDEATGMLDIIPRSAAPTMLKLNALVPIDAARDIMSHPRCDALVVSNTIPWGQLSDQIDWEGIFGSKASPLAGYGGGGLSGKPLLPIVTRWIRRARSAGVVKPIVGGGGILSQDDAAAMLDAGADAVELGAVSILRPWRVRGIIQYVNARMSN